MERLQLQLTQEPNQLKYNPILMRERSDSLLEYAVEHKDCDSLHLATFLAMQADVVMDQPHDPTPFEHPWACEWRHGQLHYVHGVLCYKKEDYECAANDFRSAAAAAAYFDAPDQQIFALHALGSVEMNRRNYGEALSIYEQAYDLDPDFHMPTHLNNLAYASYISGDCAAALRWCELADEVLERRLKDLPSQYFVGDRNVILLTRLLVALSQEDVMAMQSLIDQINFRDPFAGREVVAIAAVTQALQATNRPRAFEALRPTFESWISDMDSASIAEEFGVNSHLFAPWHPATEPISAAEWSELRIFPSALRGLPAVACNDDQVVDAASLYGGSHLWDWRWITLVMIGLLVLMGWFLFAEFRFSRALTATFNAVPAAQRAILDQALYMPSARRSLLKGRALVALRMLRHEKDFNDPALEGLSGIERFAAVGLKQGKSVEEVATESGLSRRAVRALSTRMGLAVFAAMLLVFAPVLNAAAASVPADSAWQWLQRGDSVAWFEALEAGVTLRADASVPEAVTCAFLPLEERPNWCRFGDARVWRDLRRAVQLLDDERVIAEGIASSRLDPNRHVTHWAQSQSQEWRRRAIWVGCALLAALVAMAILFVRNRSLLKSIPDDVVALDQIWASGGVVSDLSVLGTFKGGTGFAAPRLNKGKWSLLNASEQEVAIYLAEGLSASTIADRMSCTTRYIYNIRSSIRKKWELDADVDLVHSIRSYQP